MCCLPSARKCRSFLREQQIDSIVVSLHRRRRRLFRQVRLTAGSSPGRRPPRLPGIYFLLEDKYKQLMAHKSRKAQPPPVVSRLWSPTHQTRGVPSRFLRRLHQGLKRSNYEDAQLEKHDYCCIHGSRSPFVIWRGVGATSYQLVNGVIQRVAFATNCNKQQEKRQCSQMNNTFRTTDSGQDSISHCDCTKLNLPSRTSNWDGIKTFKT